MEVDKAWDLIEVAVAFKPSPLKSRLLTPDNPEAIHRDEHSITPLHEGGRPRFGAGELPTVLTRKGSVGSGLAARSIRTAFRLSSNGGDLMSGLNGIDLIWCVASPRRLVERKETIAISESSAGGLISAALLTVPGASAYFLGGGVIYTRKAMGALLDLTPDKLGGIRSATEPMALLLAETVQSGSPPIGGSRRQARPVQPATDTGMLRDTRASPFRGSAPPAALGNGVERPGRQHGRVRQRGARTSGGSSAPGGLTPSPEASNSRKPEMLMAKIAILDDWQDVARKSADWSPLASRADLTFFADAFDTEDEAAAALADFDILLTMRERTAFPETLLRRLPKLRMIGITGATCRDAGPRGVFPPRHRRVQHGGRRRWRSLRDRGIGSRPADSRGSRHPRCRRRHAGGGISARSPRRA